MKQKKRRMKRTWGEWVFDTVKCIIMAIAFLITLYPFIYVASMSISSQDAVLSNQVTLLPVGFSLKAYETLLENDSILIGFLNTLFYTVVGTLYSTAVTLLAAYALSRKDFVIRNILTKFFLFTMYFNGGMIASFILIKNLNLYNTRASIILPTALSVFTLIIAITFFRDYPESLIEAARIDGYNELQIFVNIVLKTSKAIVAVVILFYAVEKWNTYFNAILYLRDADKQPIQVFLAKVLSDSADSLMFSDASQGMMERSSLVLQMRYALIMVTTIPIMMVYPFAQKHLIKGAMLGSLKG
mgnify:FL=1